MTTTKLNTTKLNTAKPSTTKFAFATWYAVARADAQRRPL